MVNLRMAERVAAQLGRPVELVANPTRFGFQPREPFSAVSIWRHAMGRTDSNFLSASKKPFGAPRLSGSPFWIDVERAKAAGATFHDTVEILDDLERIRTKLRRPDDLARVDHYKRVVPGDAEVLFKGDVPAGGVKSGSAMALTRGLQVIQVVGFVITAVDLGRATAVSVQTGSIRPVAAEGLRQAGGWGAAWAGAKLGGVAGTAFGIETGPGAIMTGSAPIAGGFAGYMGFDWIADHIHEN